MQQLICVYWATALAASAQTLTTLHSFTGQPDGQTPYTGVAMSQGQDGSLYGTTIAGGANGYGAVFGITPSGKLTLYSFDSSDAGYPDAGPVLGTDGLLYGTADGYFGGLLNDGRVYSLDVATGIFTVLHNFDSSDGRTPDGPVALGPGASYYGTAGYGGPLNNGDVFSITPSGTFKVLHAFNGTDGSVPQGGGLLFGPGPHQALVGVTNYGGAFGFGTIYAIESTGAFKSVYSFDGTHGSYPAGTLVLANDGHAYGTTNGGGTSGNGVVFRISSTGVVTVLHNFTATDGQSPAAGLTLGSDGKLYGTTNAGGAHGDGTIFSLTTGGAFAKLYDFDGPDGSVPNYLTQHTDGMFYGTTMSGGVSNLGTVFRFDVGLGPFVTFVLNRGTVGATAQILGTGLTGATAVTFNGVPASSFTVASDTFLTATVPNGATSGRVQVTTPGGALTSNEGFVVLP
jgi:uncharacterized repeat protein (TIGR03803 family)